MVTEGEVLLGVQHLQQRRGGIASEIGANLVHLVQHEHRVLGPHALDGLDDATGQGANIGAAVPPYLRLIPHAAQRHANELSAQRAGDGSPQRSLARSRGAYEVEDGALGLLGCFSFFSLQAQLAHRQVLQDALLYFLKVIVVLVQYLAGTIDIQVVISAHLPGKADQPIQVGLDDRVLGGCGWHA